ncbi:MAG TPA: hypothetical protein VNN55_11510 [bacterium]|nr:hypothetical protein [bacterium]
MRKAEAEKWTPSRETGDEFGRNAVLRLTFRRKWVQLAAVLGATTLTLSFCGSKSNEPDPVVIKQIWYTPAWSPDGREIVCTIWRRDDSFDGAAFTAVLDASTGEILRERPQNALSPFAFSWTPDGKWLLFGAGPGIFKMTSDLDSLVQLTSGEFHDNPSYSRARNLVFFTVNDGRVGGLFSVTLEGDSLRRWSTQETLVFGTSAFPDESDSLVGFSGTQGGYWLMVFSPEAIGSALQLSQSGQPGAQISLDHRYVAYNKGTSLILLDRGSGSPRTITTLLTTAMSFSADGGKLVYPILAGKEVGLWIFDLATGEHTRLTDGTR